jgi:hypothetical protein
MAAANPLWGAPRIHGQLLKLGIDISEEPYRDSCPEGVDLLLQSGFANVLAHPVRIARALSASVDP